MISARPFHDILKMAARTKDGLDRKRACFVRFKRLIDYAESTSRFKKEYK